MHHYLFAQVIIHYFCTLCSEQLEVVTVTVSGSCQYMQCGRVLLPCESILCPRDSFSYACTVTGEYVNMALCGFI